MIQRHRGTIIAALVVVELAILGEAGMAIRGNASMSPFAYPTAPLAVADGLAENGPHRTFAVAFHPALTVDIGYADLTIETHNAPQIDVALSRGSSIGFLRATTPIVASKTGDTVRVAAIRSERGTMGDARMVTIVVPADTQVTVVNAGDINVSGLRAEASIHATGSGDMTVEDYDAPALRVSTSHGDIDLRRVAARHLIATANGGHVVGTGLKVVDGTIESDDRVTLGFANGTDALITAQTDDGKVSVSRFPGTVAAVQRPADDNNEGSDASAESVRIGAGTGRVDIHTSDGNVHLTLESS